MNILIPISDHLYGDAILQFVKERLNSKNAVYKSVHVILPAHEQTGESTEERIQYFNCELEDAEKLLTEASKTLRKYKPGSTIEHQVLIGHPAQTILAYAQDWPADMIILGAHTRSTVEQIMLGSVARFVADHATCSLCIVRIANGEALDFHVDEREILEELGVLPT